MRRAVVAAIIMAAFTFVGIGPGLGHQLVVIGASLTADMRPAINSASLTAAIRPAKETSVPEVPEKSTANTASASTASTSTASTSTDKTVTYQGVQFRVPASWPVYWLNQDPDQCVRYDINAVYVGTPGPDQDCPAGVIGRADTISIGGMNAPQGQTGQTTQVTPAQSEQLAVLRGQPVDGTQAVGTANTGTANTGTANTGSVAPGTIFQNPDTRQFAVAMPASLPWITATYGSDPALVAESLATVQPTSTQSAAPGNAKLSSPVKRRTSTPSNPAWPKEVAPPAGFDTIWSFSSQTAPQYTATQPTVTQPSTGWPFPAPTASATPTPKASTTPTPKASTTPAPKASATPAPPSPTPAPVPATLPKTALAGFDTCTAPSLATMKAWKAKYSAVGIYIGGQMVACDTGNLSAGWVKQAKAMGWSLLPTFVGLQAPCNSFSGKINAKQAASQGTAAANQAIVNAQSFGLGTGTPIYYDMEAYNDTNSSCRTAVLTFLDAWDRQLQHRGYVSGVYSSANAGIGVLQSTTTIAGHALAEPKAVWFALWDNANNLTGSPYMSASVWSVASRSKQYAGNKTVKVGGITLNIDADWMNGPMVRG